MSLLFLNEYHYTNIFGEATQAKREIKSICEKANQTDQLVTSKYQSIGRFNNYAVLPNISCLKECNIVGKLLVDHPLSYALTATTDVVAVYLQQFWKTV
ncbi:hypothetical protein Tco_0802924, partial [Tanacetum coccineum]